MLSEQWNEQIGRTLYGVHNSVQFTKISERVDVLLVDIGQNTRESSDSNGTGKAIVYVL